MKKSISCLLIAVLCCCLLSSCSHSGQNHAKNEELLALSDDVLYERIYFQNLDLVESFIDEQAALRKISPVRRTVYILSMYDMEIQNGGLCQFFVNPTRALAPYVEECLETIGAQEHKKLFTDFVKNNGININDLSSFIIQDVDEFAAQTERYDFNSFDDSYIQLTPLKKFIVNYIRANIDEFS